MKKITEEQWIEAAKWLSEGMKQKDVALKLGCSQVRVSQKFGKKRVKHSGKEAHAV